MQKLSNVIRSSITKSPLETRFFNEIRWFGLFPKCQYPFECFFLDFAFPEKKLAIEIDGSKYHMNDRQRAKDAYKDSRLRAKCWKVERFQGWIIYRHKELAASKIALRYFMDRLTETQKNHAMGRLEQFMVRNFNYKFDYGE